MRFILSLFMLVFVAACSSSDGSGQVGPSSCNNQGQKEFVLLAMQEWYLWNDLLPNDVRLRDFASPADPDSMRPRDLDDIIPGGLGTHFIREIMDSAEFLPPPGGEGNLLQLTKKIGPSDEL